MIKTHVIEQPGGLGDSKNAIDLGWCYFAISPILPGLPCILKVNERLMQVIGVRWDVDTQPKEGALMANDEAVMMLTIMEFKPSPIVQVPQGVSADSLIAGMRRQ